MIRTAALLTAMCGGLAGVSIAQDVVDDAGSMRGGKVGSWPSMVADGDTLGVAYYCEADGGTRFALRFAWNDGSGWQRRTITSGSGGAWSQLARANDGTWHVVWYSFGGLRWATGFGNDWTIQPGDVDMNFVYPVCPSIAIDTQNNPHVVYVEGDPDGNGEMRYTHRSSGAWVHDSTSLITTHAYPSPSLGGDYLSLDSSGSPHVAYVQPDNGSVPGTIHLRHIVSGSWQDEFVGPPAYDVKLAIDANDAAHLVYSTTDGLSYATNAGGAWIYEAIQTDIQAMSLSFKLDANDQPVVGFRRGVPSTFESGVACARRDNGVWTVSEVDIAGENMVLGGIGTAIAVDAHDIPHLAYGAMTIDGTGWFIQDLMSGTPAGSCVTIVASPLDAQTCPTGTAEFTVAASSDSPLSYQWQASANGTNWQDLVEGTNSVNGQPMDAAGCLTPTMTLSPSPQANDDPFPMFTLSVRCRLTSDCGSTTSGAGLLTVCPADLTCDHELNFFDVQVFLSLFADQDGDADWNDDGAIDFFDVQAFLAQFAAGCP